jgi:hypothetical protein
MQPAACEVVVVIREQLRPAALISRGGIQTGRQCPPACRRTERIYRVVALPPAARGTRQDNFASVRCLVSRTLCGHFSFVLCRGVAPVRCSGPQQRFRLGRTDSNVPDGAERLSRKPFAGHESSFRNHQQGYRVPCALYLEGPIIFVPDYGSLRRTWRYPSQPRVRSEHLWLSWRHVTLAASRIGGGSARRERVVRYASGRARPSAKARIIVRRFIINGWPDCRYSVSAGAQNGSSLDRKRRYSGHGADNRCDNSYRHQLEGCGRGARYARTLSL